MRWIRLVLAFATGCLVAIGVAKLGFESLRTAWPDYAAAEPEKAYTLAMLFARLGLAALLTAAAGAAATLVAGDHGLAAWCVGGFFLLVSLPVHLDTVWNDYPTWYHFVYLLSLVPIAVLAGRIARRARPLSKPS